ncbi:cytochrome P450 [Mycena maculata]|uniref:Cytochrome P450 n=1 Tax=Mycena maculata TaxID=230809 RepID=A0AAD7IJR4_9AGAR|nr:cytochrome P450 [Mycena maculata]
MISKILFPLAVTLPFYLLLQIFHLVYGRLTHPLRHIAGPRNPSFILGNLKKMTDDTQLTEKWRNEFGRTFKFNGLFSISHFHTTDVKALTRILAHSSIYQRFTADGDNTRRLSGDSLIVVETGDHKRQNPAFGGAQIRLLTETFIQNAERLRDTLASQVAQEKGAAGHVMGKAGESLIVLSLILQTGKPNKLNDAFTNLLHSPNAELYAGFRIVQSLFPLLWLLPVPGTKASETARAAVFDVVNQIVSERKNIEGSELEKALSEQRDLLSVMIKANVSADRPESQRLSDAEVIAQIPGLLLAGHERPTMDELNSFPYLESVVRETLRVHAPVAFVNRMAIEDNVLPLSQPYIDTKGKSHDSLT